MSKIKRIQSSDWDKSETELMNEAIYKTSDDGSFEINYEESSATGFAGANTVVNCFGNKYVSILRSGDNGSNLIIDIEKKTTLSL